MTRKEALADAIAKVEAGKIYQPESNKWGKIGLDGNKCWKAYFGSLDAAKALHEAVLPMWVADIKIGADSNPSRAIVSPLTPMSGNPSSITEWAGNPARAWLLAILRALHSMEPDT